LVYHLNVVRSELQRLCDAEQSAFERTPEGLHIGWEFDAISTMEQVIDSLKVAGDQLEEVYRAEKRFTT
jgi:surface antigen